MGWANLPLPSWLGNQFKSDERRFPLPFFLSFPSLGCSVFIDWAAFFIYTRAIPAFSIDPVWAAARRP